MSDPDYMPDLSAVNKTKSTDTLTIFLHSTVIVNLTYTITYIVQYHNNDKDPGEIHRCIDNYTIVNNTSR